MGQAKGGQLYAHRSHAQPGAPRHCPFPPLRRRQHTTSPPNTPASSTPHATSPTNTPASSMSPTSPVSPPPHLVRRLNAISTPRGLPLTPQCGQQRTTITMQVCCDITLAPPLIEGCGRYNELVSQRQARWDRHCQHHVDEEGEGGQEGRRAGDTPRRVGRKTADRGQGDDVQGGISPPSRSSLPTTTGRRESHTLPRLRVALFALPPTWLLQPHDDNGAA